MTPRTFVVTVTSLGMFALGACSSGSSPRGPETGAIADATADVGYPPPQDAGADAVESSGSGAWDAVATDGAGDAREAAAVDASVPPLCDIAAMWDVGALLAASTPLDDALGSITPDELSIAWSADQAGTAVIHYADRAAPTDAFGPATTLAFGPFAADRVTLSPDGLRLVVVNADRLGFSELTRPTRTAPFGAPTAGAFTTLNQPGALQPGELYGDPVLTADDVGFLFSLYGGTRTATLLESSRLFSSDAWPAGYPLASPPELAAQGGKRRRPTGMSSDLRTLFFWDEVTSLERAAWYGPGTGLFQTFVDLADRRFAQPNAACTTLYYSAPGASSVDLFAAKRK